MRVLSLLAVTEPQPKKKSKKWKIIGGIFLALIILGAVANSGNDPQEKNDVLDTRATAGETDSSTGSTPTTSSADRSPTPSPSESKAPPAKRFEFVDTNHDRNEVGYFTIVGIVKNNASQNAEFVKISATAYTADGTVFDTDFTYTTIDVIPAGGTSPFQVLIEDNNAEIADYKLTISQSWTDKQPTAEGLLSISGDSGRSEGYGYYEIVGEVQNSGSKTTTFTQVVAAAFDSDGKIMYADFTYTDPSDVEAGTSAPFKVLISESSGTPSSYQLWVQASGQK